MSVMIDLGNPLGPTAMGPEAHEVAEAYNFREEVAPEIVEHRRQVHIVEINTGPVAVGGATRTKVGVSIPDSELGVDGQRSQNF